MIERELKYFILLKRIRPFLDSEKVSSYSISQSYFPTESVENMANLALESMVLREVPVGTIFSQARLRHMKSEAEQMYLLEVKGNAPQHNDLERTEVSTIISRELFEELSPKATAGHFQKKRYRIEGQVSDPDEGFSKVFAEIDVPEFVGPARDPLPEGLVAYATIDIELSERKLIDPMRNGQHNFEFLSAAVELTLLEDSDRGALSTARLAVEGFDKRALDAVRRCQVLSFFDESEETDEYDPMLEDGHF